METLIIIGIALVVVCTLCACVDEMARVRGRHRGAWTIAAFIGLWFALVGWVAIVLALVALGPTEQQRRLTGPNMPTAPRPGRP